MAGFTPLDRTRRLCECAPTRNWPISSKRYYRFVFIFIIFSSLLLSATCCYCYKSASFSSSASRDEHDTSPTAVLFTRTKHHKGSIYCLGWSPAGDLIATGSNDKTVKLMRFNADTCSIDGGIYSALKNERITVDAVLFCLDNETELAMHDGTVRDVCFIEDMTNKSSLLVSGGAGDCKIYVTDCATGSAFQAFVGHSGICFWLGQ